MLKIGQNWGKIANYPPNAQQRSAPLAVSTTKSQIPAEYIVLNCGEDFFLVFNRIRGL